jgi:hypothetical protein
MYQEIQKPRQWWVLLIVYGVAALMWGGLVQQIMLGHPFGSTPAPDSVLIACWIAFGIGLPLLWISVRMIVRVNGEALTIRYQPFMTRRIPIDAIAGYGVRTYDPLREYGGWGIRIWLGGPRAYNVSGNRGVDVILYNGERIMIGSQHPHDLAQALDARLG